MHLDVDTYMWWMHLDVDTCVPIFDDKLFFSDDISCHHTEYIATHVATKYL